MTADLSVFEKLIPNLETLEIDQIKERLAPLIKGMKVESPIFEPGAFLYRGRIMNSTFKKTAGISYADLIYPPPQNCSLGRLNRKGHPMFYSSLHKESVFFELQDLRPGDELILTFWQTTEKMLVNNVGYTEFVFKKLGAKRPCPQWTQPDAGKNEKQATVSLPVISREELEAILPDDQNSALRAALSEYFMCSVGLSQNHSYKLTTAIGELHLGTIVNKKTQFAGLLYPSVRMWANGDNIALLPWFVDQHVKFKKATHIRIDSQDDNQWSITTLDSASEFGLDGTLVWLGRLPNWQLQPGQSAKFTATAGVDTDGDYSTDPNGVPCHWVAIDSATGLQIRPR